MNESQLPRYEADPSVSVDSYVEASLAVAAQEQALRDLPIGDLETIYWSTLDHAVEVGREYKSADHQNDQEGVNHIRRKRDALFNLATIVGNSIGAADPDKLWEMQDSIVQKYDPDELRSNYVNFPWTGPRFFRKPH